jgi:hypothetical protein
MNKPESNAKVIISHNGNWVATECYISQAIAEAAEWIKNRRKFAGFSFKDEIGGEYYEMKTKSRSFAECLDSWTRAIQNEPWTALEIFPNANGAVRIQIIRKP